jgi:hypothetical protein
VPPQRRWSASRHAKVTRAGTSATDYPPGDPVTPAPALPAVWINTAVTGTIRAVIVSAGPGGALKVHAYGYCAPVPCSWGTVAGTTFTVQTWTEFTGHSGRSNYTTEETLVPLR